MEDRKSTPFGKKNLTREEIDQALKDYLSQGGKVKKEEPYWIEEPKSLGYVSRRH